MGNQDNQTLSELARLYAKYGKTLTLTESEQELCALMGLLSTVRESHALRNGNSNTVTSISSNNTEDA